MFQTKRLIISPITEQDSEFILELFNTPKWKSMIGDRQVNSVEDARKYIINKMLKQFEKLGYGNFKVVLRENQKTIGTCGLYKREGLDSVDIGFALLPEFEGNGYAFESSSRILEAGFLDFHLEEIFAITIQENQSSQKLIEKLGLFFQEKINIPNDPEDLLLYKITKEEFLKGKS